MDSDEFNSTKEGARMLIIDLLKQRDGFHRLLLIGGDYQSVFNSYDALINSIVPFAGQDWLKGVMDARMYFSLDCIDD